MTLPSLIVSIVLAFNYQLYLFFFFFFCFLHLVLMDCLVHFSDRFLPDKAIDLIDEAGSRVRLRHAQV